MKKILLTWVVDVNINSYLDGSYDRFTKNQDIFTRSCHWHICTLHFLAQNISSPCVILENASLEEFAKELSNGYDFVGISFTVVNIAKVLEMSRTVRRVSPQTQIIWGGHGVMSLDTIFGADEEKKKSYFDYACYGDGVSFMRELLGEKIGEPIKQINGPTGSSSLPWLNPYPSGDTGHGYLVAGLGCDNKCEFCSTSALYKGNFIEIASAEDLFQGLKEWWRRHPHLTEVIINDENFMKNKQKVKQLGDLISNDTEFGLKKINYTTFSSIEELSRYDFVEDLLLGGLGNIWIGIESKFSDLTKRQGRSPAEVFEEFHRLGIITWGSWIGGWDFHTKENIREDIDFFISCEPCLYQIFPLFPMLGTPLYYQLEKEGRVSFEGDIEQFDPKDFKFKNWPKNFTQAELAAIMNYIPLKLYHEKGSHITRIFRVFLNGYKFCKNSNIKSLREDKSQYYRENLHDIYPLIKSCEYFAPNQKIKEKIAQMRLEYNKEFGPASKEQELYSSYIFIKAALAKISSRIGQLSPIQYFSRRYSYDRDNMKHSEVPYTVEYFRSARYEFEISRQMRENLLIGKLREHLQNNNFSEGSHDISEKLNKIVTNIDHIGEMALLVELLADEIQLPKEWQHLEVLKKMGSNYVYPDHPGGQALIEEVEQIDVEKLLS